MTRMQQLVTKVSNHDSQIESSPYDDRIPSQPFNSMVSGTEDSSPVGASLPQLLPHTTPPLNTYDYIQSFHPSFTPQPEHDGFLPPPQLAHPTYSLMPVEYELSSYIPTACWNQALPQPSEFYSQWSSYCGLPQNPPCNASPPIPRHSTLWRPACRQPPWITGDIQTSSGSSVNVDEVLPAPNNHGHPTFSVPPAPPCYDLDTTSEPHSATLDASYPCQWMKDGVVCGVMVEAKRPQMNRHLHKYHAFGGSETRQTRCRWAGCEATMQQGSIARHMVTCHLQAKVTCSMCFKKLSRQDVISKHQRVCPAARKWR